MSALRASALLAAALSLPTSPLDQLAFYGPSTLTPNSSYRTVIAQTPSLNSGLWAAANSTRAEQPFIFPPHAAGMELVVNTSASPACTGALSNMSSAAGVATLPTGPGFQGIFLALSFSECASLCCSQSQCAAFAFYETADEGALCQTYGAGYATGPQPFPAGRVAFAQGAALTTAPLSQDDLQNGLRSGTYLGGLGTGGYELRADGTAHLSTTRNQAPAAEPWQGTVRDFALAVALDGDAFAVAVRPLAGLGPVPQLVYEAAFPVARFSFLGSLRLYAYTALAPGDANASNTPAVLFTLHATNTAGAPVNVTFAVAQGLALRNDWAGVPAGAGAPAPVAAASASACAAACASQPCLAWQFQASQGLCWLDAQRHAQGANAAGFDSGFPGAFSAAQGPPGVVFTTAASKLHNGLGSQGLFALGGAADSGALSFGAAAGETLEGALAQVLLAPALPSGAGGVGAAGQLHGAAAARVAGLGAGDSASLTLAHAWHFPTYFWYRDSFAGSDNGVRYANTFATLADVVRSLNATAICARLLAWQAVYAGLPHALLRDAAANYFSHLRSSVWHADGQYRQWEALEFSDWGNPTNGDERHLPYLFAAPGAMKSQLLTWVEHAQNDDGSFYCIIMSAAGDQQYGRGDPCANAPPHPDDISMVMIAAYEQLIFRNDSALVAQVYPALLKAFGYYTTVFNATPWALPYRVHETYDAVAESASITGEGNLGTSLFNALEYLTGLLCMAGLADSQGDAATARAARAQAQLAQASIQRNLFLPSASVYVGDTLEGNAMLLTEPSGFPYHGSDNLHGQVLAYRLGFGDLLPRAQMQLHSNFIARDLGTQWGLQFDTFSQQNWLMADHAMSSLMLHWNEAGAWNATLRQLGYFRDGRKDAGRHTAVMDTSTGSPLLLNYYGYALFFYHTLHGFSGQTAHLPQGRLAFSPHFSAFNASGVAVLPLLLAGALGTVEIAPASATLTLLLPDAEGPESYAFLNVTICQHVFLARGGGAPFALRAGAPLRLALPAPCATALPASASTAASADFCAIVGRVADNGTSFAGRLPAPLPQPLSLEACEARALAHRFCGFLHDNASSACTLVPGGTTCFLAPGGAARGAASTKGLVRCDFSPVYAPPRIVNASQVRAAAGVGFAAPFAPLDSALYSFVPEQGLQGCMAQAALAQVCGGALVPALGRALGGCAGGGPCCLLNPYKGCALGAGEGPWGNATLFVFGDSGVFPELAPAGAIAAAAAAAPPLPPTAAAARAFPPRGFNPCNGFGCDMSAIGEATLRALADAIAANGMLAAGYSWFIMDDGIVSARDARGALVADPRGFPSGVRALADYVGARGLSLGAYTDRGTVTCEGRPGAKGHEAQDAATWASWGVRWLKEDSCAASPDFAAALAEYGAMKAGLAATGADVFFSLCGWFSGFAAFSALPLGDAWRIGTDVPSLARFAQNIEAAAAAAAFAGPGKGWPDVDMIGGHWPADAERLHVCFIALVGAPLLLSWDVRDAVAGATLPLAAYLNPELLAVHADDAAPAVAARGRYYSRVAGGAVTGAGSAGIAAGAAALPVDTSVPCDSPRAAFAWAPAAGAGGAWGALEALAAPGMCLGVWDEWTGACIDAIAAQLVPCAGNADGCDARSLKWSPGNGSSLAVNLTWGGGTPLPGPLLTQVGGVPTALFVQAAAPAAPPLPLAQLWRTNITAASPAGAVTAIRGGGGECLGVAAEGAGATNVWARWLSGGDVALLLFNLGAAAARVACDAACLARLGPAARWSARDVWERADAGVVVSQDGFVSAPLPPSGGSLLLRLTPLAPV